LLLRAPDVPGPESRGTSPRFRIGSAADVARLRGEHDVLHDHHPNLPLLDPVRAFPLIGKPIADLLQPDLTVLVNIGYGDPAYGYSTAPANVPTPIGLFPHVDPHVVAADLVAGTKQGISAFRTDLAGISLSDLAGISLSDVAK